jgi:aryl-alcohol dehydrogenase-like predicted oxidoreductase
VSEYNEILGDAYPLCLGGAQPTVAAPIASARTAEQLADLLPMASLELSDDELDRLTDAGAA